MADRYGYQFTSSLNPRTWLIDGYVQADASGNALTTGFNVAGLPLTLPRGVLSLVKNSTGNYTMTFGNPSTQPAGTQTDSYFDLLHFSITPVNPAATGGLTAEVISYNLSAGTNPGFASQTFNAVTFQFESGGSAADMASGGGFTFLAVVKNSQV